MAGRRRVNLPGVIVKPAPAHTRTHLGQSPQAGVRRDIEHPEIAAAEIVTAVGVALLARQSQIVGRALGDDVFALALEARARAAVHPGDDRECRALRTSFTVKLRTFLR